MVGSTCLVQGVRPILFAPHVPRIDIFCFIHRCWPVLLPAGSTRSSSLVSRYEDCFKPMALHFPGSPLRPCGAASRFLGPCRCTWIDAKLAEIVFHSCKLACLVRRTFASSFDGATAMSILGWLRPVYPSQLRHETVVHTESSWNFETENQVWRSPTLSEKLLETETYTKLKISAPFLRALWI